MIVALSLNTALDRIVEIPHFTAGAIFRTTRASAYAGGKALNVARVVRQLQQPVRVVGTLGGIVAPAIRTACDDLGIDAIWVPIEGQTRTCFIVVDPQAEHQTVINEPGPTLTPGEQQAVWAALEAATHDGDILCISGSAPPGVPVHWYADMVRHMRARGVRVMLDASGPTFAAALAAHPWAVAPNLDECAEVFGTNLPPQALLDRLAVRADYALLTRGADGLLCASRETRMELVPPAIRALNPVGSGDALVAGFVVAMSQGTSLAEAARLGVACGTANASRFEPGIATSQQVDHVASQVALVPLAQDFRLPTP